MIYEFDGYRPDIADGVYVAPSADLIGRVRLARGSSVWFGVVLRGDTDWIEIGEFSNVQDGTVMHTDPGVVLRIGANVTIGHRAFLHGCTVGEGSLIANGAMVLDRAVIGRGCVSQRRDGARSCRHWSRVRDRRRCFGAAGQGDP